MLYILDLDFYYYISSSIPYIILPNLDLIIPYVIFPDLYIIII